MPPYMLGLLASQKKYHEASMASVHMGGSPFPILYESLEAAIKAVKKERLFAMNASCEGVGGHTPPY
jgi:hypothetical protein